jgi:hypothetical protein
MRRVDQRLKITLGAGLLVGGAAIGITLSQSPLTLVRASTVTHTTFETTRQRTEACQSNEVLPRETSAVRLRIYAFLGPRVAVALLSHGRVIADGERGSGWTSNVVTIPVNPLPTERSGLDLCFALLLNGDETASLVGERTPPALAAHSQSGVLRGRLRVEFLRPGRSSWWSLAGAIVRRIGLGDAGSGTWRVLLLALLMGVVLVLCSRAILTGLG